MKSISPKDHVAAGLADALLAGPASASDFTERMAAALGQDYPWLKLIARRAFRRFGKRFPSVLRAELIDFIRNDRDYAAGWKIAGKLHLRRYFSASPNMMPRPRALAECALPDLATPGDLAAWLGITMTELEWYADLRSMIRTTEGPLCHYRYKWIAKRHGYRLIESPKAKLRTIQRKILRDMLDLVPPHPVAHGFRRGHSCVTYAMPHIGKSVVLRMDLRDFFGSIPAGRITALFKTLGYPEATARYLSGLCTNSVPPRATLKTPGIVPGFSLPWLERKKLTRPHLPQGAPTSPALANLCAFHFDCRLSALATSMKADYTRYADDIAFSGDEKLRRRADRIGLSIAAIALEEKFDVNFRKTRIMHKSDRQILTGIVVNEGINIQRREYDRLKATLHNCLRFSPASQNRQNHPDFRAHLLGRVHYMISLSPQRGEKLKAIFERIEW